MTHPAINRKQEPLDQKFPELFLKHTAADELRQNGIMRHKCRIAAIEIRKQPADPVSLNILRRVHRHLIQ